MAGIAEEIIYRGALFGLFQQLLGNDSAAIALCVAAFALGHFVQGRGAMLIVILFAVAFDQAFLAFHRIFFPQGNFLFGPDSNLLRLFPEPFWFDAALAAGGSIVVTALAVAAIGWRLLRRSA